MGKPKIKAPSGFIQSIHSISLVCVSIVFYHLFTVNLNGNWRGKVWLRVNHLRPVISFCFAFFSQLSAYLMLLGFLGEWFTAYIVHTLDGDGVFCLPLTFISSFKLYSVMAFRLRPRAKLL